MVVRPQNVLRAEVFFWGYGLKIVMGSRYLGGFAGTEVSQIWQLEDKVEGWQYLVDIISGVACTRPKTSYGGLEKSLQKEWDFVQRITTDIGKGFQTVEDSVQ